jgi:hypothetical protein
MEIIDGRLHCRLGLGVGYGLDIKTWRVSWEQGSFNFIHGSVGIAVFKQQVIKLRQAWHGGKVCVRRSDCSNNCWRHTHGVRAELEIIEGVVWERTFDATKFTCAVDHGMVYLAIV